MTPRFLALNNRVVGGILITTTRRKVAKCPAGERFSHLKDSVRFFIVPRGMWKGSLAGFSC